MIENKKNRIAVEVDGVLVVSTDGHISTESPEMEAAIKENANVGVFVTIVPPSGRKVLASLSPDDPVGNLAAMISPSPGRWVALELPEYVADWIEEDEENRSFSMDDLIVIIDDGDGDGNEEDKDV